MYSSLAQSVERVRRFAPNEANNLADIYSDCLNEQGGKICNEKESSSQCECEDKQGLILLKKKVTTHYVPPDLAAVKMLLENFGKEITTQNRIENMKDDELLELRSEIIKELKGDAF